MSVNSVCVSITVFTVAVVRLSTSLSPVLLYRCVTHQVTSSFSKTKVIESLRMGFCQSSKNFLLLWSFSFVTICAHNYVNVVVSTVVVSTTVWYDIDSIMALPKYLEVHIGQNWTNH